MVQSVRMHARRKNEELLIFSKLWDTNLAGKDSKPKGSGVLSRGSITPQSSQGNSNAQIYVEHRENRISLGNCTVTENLFTMNLKVLSLM